MLFDYLEGIPAVMSLKVFYVFQKKSRWLVMFQDSGYFKEQIPLIRVIESVLSAQRPKFRDSCQ